MGFFAWPFSEGAFANVVTNVIFLKLCSNKWHRNLHSILITDIHRCSSNAYLNTVLKYLSFVIALLLCPKAIWRACLFYLTLPVLSFNFKWSPSFLHNLKFNSFKCSFLNKWTNADYFYVPKMVTMASFTFLRRRSIDVTWCVDV